MEFREAYACLASNDNIDEAGLIFQWEGALAPIQKLSNDATHIGCLATEIVGSRKFFGTVSLSGQ
jgi:hypothetical protein